jgi:L-asparaginase II
MKFLQVEIYRADILESRHRVMACLVDGAGQVVDQWGAQNDLAQPVFPRSAIKPLQALHFLESGAWQAFDLSDQHLVFSASSHEGESFHLQLALEWMRKLGFQQSDLCCGGHWPTHVASQHELIRQGKKPEATWNNCSGKHLGILSTCRHLGMDIANYGAWEHPIQVDLRNKLSLWLDCDLHQSPWGIDGCGIPTMAFPLKNLAKGMAHLLTGSNIAAETLQLPQ